MSPNPEEVRQSIRKFSGILPHCAQDFIVRNCFEGDSDDWNEKCAIISARVEALASAFRATRAGTPATRELASGTFAYSKDLMGMDMSTTINKSIRSSIFLERGMTGQGRRTHGKRSSPW
jgi:hypothetical protein